MPLWDRLAVAERDQLPKWKRMPASEDRLMAMAERYVLEENQDYLQGMDKSMERLDDEERKKFECFRKYIFKLTFKLTQENF